MIKIKRTVSIFFKVVFLLVLSPVWALYNRYGIPDSSEIRKDLVETWFEAPLETVRMNRAEIRTNSIGEKFQVRLEETDSSFNIFVAPYARMEVDVISDKGKTTVTQDVYPGDAIGSWVLIRDKKTGRPLRIRWYFASDSEVYVQFVPSGKTSYADFIVYGSYAVRGAPTGLKLERFYTASYDQMVRWTNISIPWKYTYIYPDNYKEAAQMIGTIRDKLSSIQYTEDAMYDGDGKPVYISTGKERKVEAEYVDKITVNGAGFLKWIADGLVEPLTGGALKREPLVMETVNYKDNGYQGILAENFSLSFTLDWIRNLASALVSVRTHRQYLFNESGVDVRIEPFCADLTDKGIINTIGFIDNTGYKVYSIKPLLYVLAVTEPKNFYFGAIRETDYKTPEVKVFNESLIIFPYFDSQKHFRCVIFKDGQEISLEEFTRRYYKDFVFLTRAQCSEQFFPK